MKKLLTIFLVLMMLLSSSMVAFASNAIEKDYSEKTSIASKAVVVGYNIKDKNEIFGEKSDEEINKILQEIIQELLKNERIQSSYVNSKLIITATDKEKGTYFSNVDKSKASKVTKSNKINGIGTRIADEYGVRETFLYKVGFDTIAGYVDGDYMTILDGVVSRVDNWAIIDGMDTFHIAGGSFNFSDMANGTSNASVRFSHLDLAGYSSFLLKWHITLSGDIVFDGQF